MKTLDLIKQHGLSVRQIPLQVVHLYSMRHHKPGNEIVRVKLKNKEEGGFAFSFHVKRHSASPDFELDHVTQTVTRLYTREITVPQNAGFWMAQKTSGTSSQVVWSTKRDNLAPTLEESVALCVQNLS